MMRASRNVLVALVVAAGASCVESESADPTELGGEVVPADNPEPIPGSIVITRYWVEVEPMQGRLALYPLHPGNVIYRGEHSEALSYDFSGAPVTVGNCQPPGNCLPAANTVKLSTNQTQVTYKDSNGICHSNGAIITCPATQPCSNTHTFCAPIQMVSNYGAGGPPRVLPDVIIQAAQNNNLANHINGCQDTTNNTSGGSFGLCHAVGNVKVDAASSNVTSPIPGQPTAMPPSFGCSYCYGNPAAAGAANLPGLADGVTTGLNATLSAVNTDTFALALQNDANHSITITVRSAQPSFDVRPISMTTSGRPAACATASQTIVTVTGGGFGLSNPCLASIPPASCPPSGAPAPGYDIRFVAPGGATVSGTNVTWSDTSVTATIPSNAFGGPVSIVTPGGAITTIDHFALCSPVLTLSPNIGGPNRLFVASGSGFTPGEMVQLRFNGTLKSTFIADGNGNFSGNSNALQLPNGSYPVTATGVTSGIVASTNFTVAGLFTISPTSGGVGDAITLAGSGYGANELVDIEYKFAGGSFMPAVSAMCDSNGNFTTSFAMPPHTAGQVTFDAFGPISQVDQSGPFQLVATIVPSPTHLGPGALFNVSGGGFGPNEQIIITFDSPTGTEIGITNADANGSYAMSNRHVPLSHANGLALVVATGQTSGLQANNLVDIVGSFTVNPTAGPVGSAVILSGSGYGANEVVDIEYIFPGGPFVPAVTVSTDASGSFTATFVLPAHPGSFLTFDAFGTLTNTERSAQFQLLPQLLPNPTLFGPGRLINVNGTGFGATELVSINFDTPTGTQVGLAMTDANGNFTANNLRVAQGVANGSYGLWGTGGTSGLQAFAFVDVTGSFTVNPTSGPAGTIVTFNGTGYGANEVIDIEYHFSGGGFMPGVGTTSDANGNFAATFVIPTHPADTITFDAFGTTTQTERFVTFQLVP
jgi:hypothetical protein